MFCGLSTEVQNTEIAICMAYLTFSDVTWLMVTKHKNRIPLSKKVQKLLLQIRDSTARRARFIISQLLYAIINTVTPVLSSIKQTPCI